VNRRILIIGTGAIAHYHAQAVRLLPGAALLGADPSPAARAKFAADFPEAILFDTPEAMLASAPAGPDDIVVVATAPWLHAAHAIMALEAGFHVLCEKPLGRTMAEVDAILAAAQKAGRMLGDCCIRFNGQPAMVRARDLITAGDLGGLTLVRLINRINRERPGIEYQPTSRWFLNREMAGGGVLMDWAVYDISMLFDVLRPVAATIHAASVNGIDGINDPTDVAVEVECAAVAMMTLTLPDGATVPFVYERANGVNGPSLHELSVDGRKGGLGWQWLPPYENDSATVTRYLDKGGSVGVETEAVPMADHPFYSHQPLLALVDRVAGRPSVSLDEAAIRFQFAVISSIYDVAARGEPVTVRR
jgi:predicted dehydrogenase